MCRIRIQLPDDLVERIRESLVIYGSRECGGVLMGEHVGEDEFRIVDLTVQSKPGTIFRFVRVVADLVKGLLMFFERTEHRYRQYNYLGEWHSHPLFALQPSRDDFRAMQGIVEDSNVGAHFAVLLLVKLDNSSVQTRAWSLLPGGVFVEADVVAGGANHERK